MLKIKDDINIKKIPNQYVRTKDGKIAILCEIINGRYLLQDEPYSFRKEDIINSSSNILDLIKDGDYINGVRIDEIISKSENDLCFRYKYYLEEYDVYTFNKNDIKSIVTKEQFENVAYEVN